VKHQTQGIHGRPPDVVNISSWWLLVSPVGWVNFVGGQLICRAGPIFFQMRKSRRTNNGSGGGQHFSRGGGCPSCAPRCYGAASSVIVKNCKNISKTSVTRWCQLAKRKESGTEVGNGGEKLNKLVDLVMQWVGLVGGGGPLKEITTCRIASASPNRRVLRIIIILICLLLSFLDYLSFSKCIFSETFQDGVILTVTHGCRKLRWLFQSPRPELFQKSFV